VVRDNYGGSRLPGEPLKRLYHVSHGCGVIFIPSMESAQRVDNYQPGALSKRTQVCIELSGHIPFGQVTLARSYAKLSAAKRNSLIYNE
jgi:hypothetical protein